MQLLKTEGVIGVKACKAIIYKVSDVLRMFAHWNVPVPQFLYNILMNKVLIFSLLCTTLSTIVLDS